eukprot:scaffold65_cov233-Pinguiococcus_pyrenoidosus.AAC.6
MIDLQSIGQADKCRSQGLRSCIVETKDPFIRVTARGARAPQPFHHAPQEPQASRRPRAAAPIAHDCAAQPHQAHPPACRLKTCFLSSLPFLPSFLPSFPLPAFPWNVPSQSKGGVGRQGGPKNPQAVARIGLLQGSTGDVPFDTPTKEDHVRLQAIRTAVQAAWRSEIQVRQLLWDVRVP